jgi:hypothetical protein
MRRVIRRHIRRRAGGVDLAVDVNAVIAVNRGTGRTDAVQSTQVVQDATAHAGDERADRPPGGRDDDSPQEER